MWKGTRKVFACLALFIILPTFPPFGACLSLSSLTPSPLASRPTKCRSWVPSLPQHTVPPQRKSVNFVGIHGKENYIYLSNRISKFPTESPREVRLPASKATSQRKWFVLMKIKIDAYLFGRHPIDNLMGSIWFVVVIWQIQKQNWVSIWSFYFPSIVLNESFFSLKFTLNCFPQGLKEKKKRLFPTLKNINILEDSIKGFLESENNCVIEGQFLKGFWTLLLKKKITDFGNLH